MNEYQVSGFHRALQIVLLVLIVIGLGLLFTQKKWVPHVVNFILEKEQAANQDISAAH